MEKKTRLEEDGSRNADGRRVSPISRAQSTDNFSFLLKLLRKPASPVKSRLFRHKCQACCRTFAFKRNRELHLSRRSVRISYPCQYCREKLTFFNPCVLFEHIMTHKNSVVPIDLESADVFRLSAEDLESERLNGDVKPLLMVPNHDTRRQSEGSLRLHSVDFGTVEFETNNNCKIIPDGTLIHDVFDRINGRENNSQVEDNMVYAVREKAVHSARKAKLSPKTDVNMNEKLMETIEISDDDESKKKDEQQREAAQQRANELISNFRPIKDLHRCIECFSIFSNGDALKNHFMGMGVWRNKPKPCEECGMMCPSKCSLQAHAKIHSLRFPHVCPECGDCSFTCYPDYWLHVHEKCLHTSRTFCYSCFKCSVSLAPDLNLLRQHMMEVHGQVQFRCVKCTSVFETKRELNAHRIKIHGGIGKTVKVMRCFLCANKSHMSIGYFKKHVGNHIKKQLKTVTSFVFKCEKCNDYFKTNQELISHVPGCTGVKKLPKKVWRPWKGPKNNATSASAIKELVTESATTFEIPFAPPPPIEKQGSSDNGRKRSSGVHRPWLNPGDQTIEEKTNLRNSPKFDPSPPDVQLPKPPILIEIPKKPLMDARYARCRSCGENFKTKREMYAHGRERHLLQNEESGWICLLCDNAKFKSSRALSLHLEEHTSRMAYPTMCPICHTSLQSYTSFYHLKMEHSLFETDIDSMTDHPLMVPEMEVPERRKSKRQQLKLKSEDRDQRLVEQLSQFRKIAEDRCTVCKKQFDDPLERKQHMRTHGMMFLQTVRGVKT